MRHDAEAIAPATRLAGGEGQGIPVVRPVSDMVFDGRVPVRRPDGVARAAPGKDATGRRPMRV